jgi:hypothetical protein
MRVYIFGPMRGIRFYNFPAFDAAVVELRRLGHEPVSPADLDRATGFDPFTLPDDWDWWKLPEGFSLDDAIKRDTAAIMTCDAAWQLDGWERSTGATAERGLIRWRGLPVLNERVETVLQEADRIVASDRNSDYGHPYEDFSRTAGMASAMFGFPVTPEQVGLFMVCIKLSRECHKHKRDNLVDLAGYAKTVAMVHERREALK